MEKPNVFRENAAENSKRVVEAVAVGLQTHPAAHSGRSCLRGEQRHLPEAVPGGKSCHNLHPAEFELRRCRAKPAERGRRPTFEPPTTTSTSPRAIKYLHSTGDAWHGGRRGAALTDRSLAVRCGEERERERERAGWGRGKERERGVTWRRPRPLAGRWRRSRRSSRWSPRQPPPAGRRQRTSRRWGSRRVPWAER